MIDAAVLQFTWVAAALVVSPGPTLAVVLRNAVADGWRGGVETAIGIGCGNAVQATVGMCGFATLLQGAPPVRAALEIAGGVYLVWLGSRSLACAWHARPVVATGATARRGFREGLTTNLLHPAVTIFYMTAVPAFIAHRPHALPQFALLAGIHVAFSTVWMSGCALVVGRAATLVTRPAVTRPLHLVSGLVLIAFGIATIVRQT